MQDEEDLGTSVLKGVSRSFYLSIQFLPRLMREPVALGYLLARASDTIADTAEVPADVRKGCLDLFVPALKKKEVREVLLGRISEEFVEHQVKEKERVLLERLGEVFRWYDSVMEWAWLEIGEVVETIVKGQLNDIEHFAIHERGKMESAAELEEYCYQVAGCVGEFWTDVGFHNCSRFSSLGKERASELGVRYGKGLQLVNILRDMPEDLANGRCYLPVDGKELVMKKALMRESRKWRQKARKYVESGVEYSRSLRQWRARVATVLPALIAKKTLDLLDEASWEDLQEGVKVTRKDVRGCLWAAVFGKF